MASNFLTNLSILLEVHAVKARHISRHQESVTPITYTIASH